MNVSPQTPLALPARIVDPGETIIARPLRSPTDESSFHRTGRRPSLGPTTRPIGEAAMRTDRPEPWGFDLYDPRITMRQLAADAQRKYPADVPETDESAVAEEAPPSESSDRELVAGGSR